MLVEANVFSVVVRLFGMVICTNFFVFLGAELVMEVVVMGKAVKVVRAKFFIFLRRDCLRKMMAARVA